MTVAFRRWLFLMLLPLSACALFESEPIRFDRIDVIHVFQQRREAERRRDIDLAEQVLVFERGADRDFLEAELEHLRGVTAGPVVAHSEIHLVGFPQDFGPGDYLFLEPVGGIYIATVVEVESDGGRPVIRYERPDVSAVEASRLSPEDVTRAAVERRIDYWQRLDDDEVEEEVERLLTTLRYQQQAIAYAAANELPLQRFQPDPAVLLAEYSSLPPDLVRNAVVFALKSSLVEVPGGVR